MSFCWKCSVLLWDISLSCTAANVHAYFRERKIIPTKEYIDRCLMHGFLALLTMMKIVFINIFEKFQIFPCFSGSNYMLMTEIKVLIWMNRFSSFLLHFFTVLRVPLLCAIICRNTFMDDNGRDRKGIM